MIEDADNATDADTPPEDFVVQVRQAMDHLYDIDYLERHPLVYQATSGAASNFQLGGQQLRWELSGAIEALNPGAHVPFATPPARIYNLVSLRYVERRTVLQAAQELNLSERQAHRDLREGERRVAAAVLGRLAASGGQEPGAAQLSSFEAETARFAFQLRPTDLGVLLRGAHAVVEPHAAHRNIRLRLVLPAQPHVLSTAPILAEQALVSMLSYAVEQSSPGEISVQLANDRGDTTISIRYPRSDPSGVPALDLVILRLLDQLGWSVHQEEHADANRSIHIQIPAQGATVLVIDDNQGLVNLLERYLTSYAYRVVSAANGQEGLRVIQEITPDAIILDVVMPEMHGWEFLQRLRAQPALAELPVIICSVIRNPHLAYSLGATLYLPKPVRRRDILDALQQLGVG